MKIRIKEIVIFLGLSLLFGCVEQPDYCTIKKPTTAMFTTEENDPNYKYDDREVYWEQYTADTLISCVVKFTAKLDSTPGTKYTWTIGKGVYHQRSFNLDFCGRPLGENNIPVKLEISANPDRHCFPTDSGKESYVRVITIGSFKTNTTLKGTFEGNWGDGKEIRLIINPAKETGKFSRWGLGNTTLAIYNFDGKNRWYFSGGVKSGYRQKYSCCFYEDSLLLPSYPIYHDRIWMRVSNENNTLVMKYTEVIRKTNQKIERTFTGKRISWNYEN